MLKKSASLLALTAASFAQPAASQETQEQACAILTVSAVTGTDGQYFERSNADGSVTYASGTELPSGGIQRNEITVSPWGVFALVSRIDFGQSLSVSAEMNYGDSQLISKVRPEQTETPQILAVRLTAATDVASLNRTLGTCLNALRPAPAPSLDL